MELSNKQMDEAVLAAQRDDDYVFAHRADNSSDIVGGRYGYLYGSTRRAVPVRPGALTPMPRMLQPASWRSDRSVGEWRPARDGGIIAPLWDPDACQISDYRIETNGGYGVEVTGRA